MIQLQIQISMYMVFYESLQITFPNNVLVSKLANVAKVNRLREMLAIEERGGVSRHN